MAILHVCNVPNVLYERIRRLAQENNRCVAAEVIGILSRAVQTRVARREAAAVIERIRQQSRDRVLPGNWVESTELIRRNRCR